MMWAKLVAAGLQAAAWVRENWKLVWALVTALLLALVVWLWTGKARLAGELKQCRDDRAAQQKELDASANIVADLEAKVKTKCKGSVDLVVKPPSSAPGANPCPEVRLRADFDGSTDSRTGAAVATSAAAKVVEKYGPGGTQEKPESWAISAGGGMSLGPATIWHGSAALDYHRLRAYGTYDAQGTWTAGAQVKLLTGNWP